MSCDIACMAVALDWTYAALVRHQPSADADQVAQIAFQYRDIARDAVGNIGQGQPVQSVACVHVAQCAAGDAPAVSQMN